MEHLGGGGEANRQVSLCWLTHIAEIEQREVNDSVAISIPKYTLPPLYTNPPSRSVCNIDDLVDEVVHSPCGTWDTCCCDPSRARNTLCRMCVHTAL